MRLGIKCFREINERAETNLLQSVSLPLCSVAHNKASAAENFSQNQTVKKLKYCVFLKNDVFVPVKTFLKISDSAQLIKIGL